MSDLIVAGVWLDCTLGSAEGGNVVGEAISSPLTAREYTVYCSRREMIIRSQYFKNIFVLVLTIDSLVGDCRPSTRSPSTLYVYASPMEGVLKCSLRWQGIDVVKILDSLRFDRESLVRNSIVEYSNEGLLKPPQEPHKSNGVVAVQVHEALRFYAGLSTRLAQEVFPNISLLWPQFLTHTIKSIIIPTQYCPHANYRY